MKKKELCRLTTWPTASCAALVACLAGLPALSVCAEETAPNSAQNNNARCQAFYDALGSVSGTSLIELVLEADLACIQELKRTTNKAAQRAASVRATSTRAVSARAASTERNQVDVANALVPLIEEYDGVSTSGVARLFTFLYVLQDIHHRCIEKQTCDGDVWDGAKPWSIAAGSSVHKAVHRTIDLFAENTHFGKATVDHSTALLALIRVVKQYGQQGDHLDIVAYWVNRWGPPYSDMAEFHKVLKGIVALVYLGHRSSDFELSYGEHRPLADAIYDFVSNRQWLGTSSQWLMEALAIELGRYTKYPNTSNYSYVAPKIRSLVETYAEDATARSIWLRIIAEVHYNDSSASNCASYGLCDWFEDAKFNANFRDLLFVDDMACPTNFCPNDTIAIHAQSLTQDDLALACRRLDDYSARFHRIFDTNCDPVPDDHNRHLDIFVFNDGDSCEAFESAAFHKNADSCSGIYWEGNPSDPSNWARFVATEYTADENPLDPDLAIWNLAHEYAHYLDGRYNRRGGYREDANLVWWIEGFAEYLATEVDPYIVRPRYDPSPYSLPDILLRSGSIPTRYRPRHLATRFYMENNREFIDLLLTHTRQGDYAGYATQLQRHADGFHSDWDEWLATPSNGGYCHGRSQRHLYGHIAEVTLGAVGNATGPNNGEYTFYADPVVVERASSLDVRIAVGTTVDVDDDSYAVEAWIDWNDDGVFDAESEQVVAGVAVLNAADAPPAVVAETVDIPLDAVGNKRMRVRVRHPSSGAPGPCENYESGEIEDYVVSVVPPIQAESLQPPL